MASKIDGDEGKFVAAIETTTGKVLDKKELNEIRFKKAVELAGTGASDQMVREEYRKLLRSEGGDDKKSYLSHRANAVRGMTGQRRKIIADETSAGSDDTKSDKPADTAEIYFARKEKSCKESCGEVPITVMRRGNLDDEITVVCFTQEHQVRDDHKANGQPIKKEEIVADVEYD